ncbi:transcriptional regulator [Bizionia hallyeonensis]|uniref:Transcriptional regulator n=1 Tax=Bizionia hallyeonensis TaxID=1123757 RepID=A0ABW0C7P2_9FLAO|nr:transcriptional regulator [Bizionia sp. M204]UPS91471.1 transcriptional regulator [Bizionia sp. M204]
MTSVITGDIINSKNVKPAIWLPQLKDALTFLESDTRLWEIYRGDSFQIELKNPQNSFLHAVYIKACVKMIKGLDVRIAIGIGTKTYQGDTVTESNGEAFQFSGETLENLKKDKINLKLKTPDPILNRDLNLYFKLALMSMDNWTVNSAEIIKTQIENPHKIQSEIAQLIGINQEAVSKRMKRANLEEILELNNLYIIKISNL